MSLVDGIALHDVVGSPMEAGKILFVPALFDFIPGTEGRLECCLPTTSPGLPPLRELMGNDDLDEDELLTYWARARIPAVFGFQPSRGWEIRRQELLSFLFVAVVRAENGEKPSAVPFACSEGGLSPGLNFRSTDADMILKSQIASAFWGLLLRDPGSLEPFEELLFDDEGGWLKVGYTQRRLFVCEVDDLDDPSGRYDPHLAGLDGELFRCPGCDGTGIENVFPFTEDCSSCGGVGGVPW